METERDSTFVVDLWHSIVMALYARTPFQLVRATITRLRSGTVAWWWLVDVYALASLVLSFLMFMAASALSLGVFLRVLFAVVALVRIWEIVAVQAEVVFFGSYYTGAGRGRRSVRGYRRLALLAVQNYFEVILWFATIYLCYPSCFDGLEALGPTVGALYFSVVTITTLGYGDITPSERLGAMLVTFQVLVGVFLVIAAVTRALSLVPAPSTHDSAEKEALD